MPFSKTCILFKSNHNPSHLSSSYSFIEFISRIEEAMKYFVLILLVLGFTLTQSSPVAKKVEKRTAAESIKTEISSKLLNPNNETNNFKPKTLKFEDPKNEKLNVAQKEEKLEEGKDLKKEDKKDELSPENDSDAEEVDREKKSCKTIKTPAPPPTKLCLEICGAPGEMEICEDDAPPPLPPPPPPQPEEPLPQINFEPQPIFDIAPPQVMCQVQPQIICEQPQVMYVPPPPPPQPTTICYETYPQQSIQPQMIQPQMIQPQMIQPQMILPQMPQTKVIQVQPQYIEPQTIQFGSSQQQFGNPQNLDEWHQYHKQLHKLHLELPKQLKTILHGSGPGSGHFGRPTAPSTPYAMQNQLATCTCQMSGSGSGLVNPGGNAVSFGSVPISSGNFAMNPTGPTGPMASVSVSDNGLARNAGLRFNTPMRHQGLMNPTMLSGSAHMSAPSRNQGLNVSWGPFSGQGMRHVRGDSGSPPHELETEQKSQAQFSEKEEQSSQISLSQSSSSVPILRINTTPNQSSQTHFSQSGLINDKNTMNEDSINIRNIEIQGQDMKPFSLSRSLHFNDDALGIKGRYEDVNGVGSEFKS